MYFWIRNIKLIQGTVNTAVSGITLSSGIVFNLTVPRHFLFHMCNVSGVGDFVKVLPVFIR